MSEADYNFWPVPWYVFDHVNASVLIRILSSIKKIQSVKKINENLPPKLREIVPSTSLAVGFGGRLFRDGLSDLLRVLCIYEPRTST